MAVIKENKYSPETDQAFLDCLQHELRKFINENYRDLHISRLPSSDRKISSVGF
jgi:hypothetical protein